MKIGLRCPQCGIRVTVFTADERTAAAHPCPKVRKSRNWTQFEVDEEDDDEQQGR